jgi:predicted metalloprotease with PDZ domain
MLLKALIADLKVTRTKVTAPKIRSCALSATIVGRTAWMRLICGALFFMLFASLAAKAQSINARISVVSLAPPRVRVEFENVNATKVWSFRNAYAGMIGLAERVENLSLFDAQGGEVAARKLAPGEYEAAREATKIRYELKLDPPRDTNDTAHVSWLTTTRGVLMPGDLLPLPLTRAKLNLTLPEGWKAATLETPNGSGQYEIEHADSSVFFIGADVRVAQSRVRGMEVKFATSGEWAFADQDVMTIIRDVLAEHERTAGVVPRESIFVMLAPFPQTANGTRWSAETRGGTVVFLSGRATSKAAGLARLSVPLAHELFHLWVPNALALDGDYDWFYEGFTVYQAMRVSVHLGYLTFQDYLDSLARAYDNYFAQRAQDKLSLPDASARRWGGSSAFVYQKGMLVAALYDLGVRQQSRGKRSLEDVYRLLFRGRRAGGERRVGNAVVIAALNNVSGGDEFSKRYIESVNQLDLTTALDAFGLQLIRNGTRTRITVSNSPNRNQRDLLRQMGYN